MSEWTDELKSDVVAAYKEAKPTPENTMDIVVKLAEDFEKTPNGVRMVLTKEGAYIKKVAAKAAASGGKTGGTRVNKAEAIAALAATISAEGKDADDEILSRLTGKAANYFNEVIKSILSDAATE
ncbi:MAG: hypothetical protein GY810_00935 [Aureispira sp.]|nr:hypothetical protein [Aureispira sp.]